MEWCFELTGAAFTRFQTLRLQKIFPNVLADQLISYGSCQFPTLGFVVERYKQVQAFIPEPFWKLRGGCLLLVSEPLCAQVLSFCNLPVYSDAGDYGIGTALTLLFIMCEK